MPFRQLADAGAQSTVAGAITNSQTTITLASASGFPALVQGGQVSVTILDTGNPSYNAAAPLATPYEYQQVNTIAGNVLTFGAGGGSAARSSYAGTTPKAFFAGATVALSILAEDIVASAPLKFDEQVVTNVATIVIPSAGTLPASYLGVSWRNLRLTWSLRTTSGNQLDVLYMRFNADASNVYGTQLLDSTGTGNATATQSNPVTQLRIGVVAGGAASSVYYGQGRCEIFYYAATDRYHHCLSNAMYVGNPTHCEQDGGWWPNGAAITAITLFGAAGNLTGTVTTYLEP